MASEYDICIRLDRINETLSELAAHIETLCDMWRNQLTPPCKFEDDVHERLGFRSEDDLFLYEWAKEAKNDRRGGDNDA